MSIIWAKIKNQDGHYLQLENGQQVWVKNKANGTLLTDSEARKWINAGFIPTVVSIAPSNPDIEPQGNLNQRNFPLAVR